MPHVALLTDSLWRRRFSADAATLGRPIALDGEPYTVVGILPPGFEFLDNSRARGNGSFSLGTLRSGN